MVHEYKYPIEDLEYFSVRYTPKFQKPIDTENYCCGGQMEEIYSRYDSLKYFESFCSKEGVNLTYNRQALESSKSSSDIDLLITFNHDPQNSSIETILHFYQDHFRNIIFCGNKKITEHFNEIRGRFKRFDSYTFIDMYDMSAGYFHYYCMTKAIEIQFNVKTGILLMSDDVLFKYWHMEKLNKEKIWFPGKVQIGGDHETMRGWIYWNDYIGNVEKLFQFVTEVVENKPISRKPDMKNYPVVLPEHAIMMRQFHKNIMSNRRNISERNITYDQIDFGVNNLTASVAVFISDIFYMPMSKLAEFHFLSDLFNRERIYLEIAVPTILGGMAANTDIEIIAGLYPWVNTEDGDPMANAFEKIALLDRVQFVHPIKVPTMDRKRYCELMIQKIWIGNSLEDLKKEYDYLTNPATTSTTTTGLTD